MSVPVHVGVHMCMAHTHTHTHIIFYSVFLEYALLLYHFAILFTVLTYLSSYVKISLRKRTTFYSALCLLFPAFYLVHSTSH